MGTMTRSADYGDLIADADPRKHGRTPKGRLRGKQPKLSAHQEAQLFELHRAGRHTTDELAELSGVGRPTIYHVVARAGAPAT